MKVLVTGGCGYIGSHAVYQLIEKNHEVVIIDDLSYGFIENLHPKAKFYQIDLKNKKDLFEKVGKEDSFDVIMHFAGYIVVPESIEKPLKYYENNLIGIINLLQFADIKNIKKFIFSSTAAVYGEPKIIPIKETNDKKPINPYGASKLMCEQIIKDWAVRNNKNYLIFRYFNVAGANENMKIGNRIKEPTHLIPAINNSILKKENKIFKIFGNDRNTPDGTCIRDFIHVDDLVNAHVMGIDWIIKNKKSEIINLGSGHGYSVLEVVNEAKKQFNEMKFEFANNRFGDPDLLKSDITMAINKLNWETKKNLEEIIKSDYKFRKKNNV